MRLLVGAAAGAALCLSCCLAAAQSGPDTISGVVVPPGQRAADFWTEEAMAAAEEIPLPSVDPALVQPPAVQPRSGGAPEQSEPFDIATGGEPTERFSGNIKSTPLKWAGRLFFTADGAKKRCSAQFIGKRLVLTAAHCVRNNQTGEFYDNFLFALQYERGRSARQYGSACFATFDGWVTREFTRYLSDFAMILINGESSVGWFGTSINWEGRFGSMTKIGYPRGEFDGEVIQVENGPITVTDGIVELRHGNNSDQHGSSGGAWIGDYATSFSSASNHVASLESFGYDSKPGVDYGPLFTDRFKVLRAYVENGCRN